MIYGWSRKIWLLLLMLQPWFAPSYGQAAPDKDGPPVRVPILLYHRFGPAVADSMTVTTPVFASHLAYLRDHGYQAIPLRQLVDYYRQKGPPPPPQSVAITIDDGHKTVYSDALPLVRQYRLPVTLFIYPSAISQAAYALTWEQLRELRQSGRFDIQSHTFWHPNFKQERKRLNPVAYEEFVNMQLKKSKARLERELGIRVDMLAWAFGIHDDFLTAKAAAAGYVAAFTLERRAAQSSDQVMRLPRYLMTNADRGQALARILGDPFRPATGGNVQK